MEKLSSSFRKLAADYINNREKLSFSWDIYAKIKIIYLYHEYAISSCFNCQELWDRTFEDEYGESKATNSPEWIFRENAYHVALF